MSRPVVFGRYSSNSGFAAMRAKVIETRSGNEYQKYDASGATIGWREGAAQTVSPGLRRASNADRDCQDALYERKCGRDTNRRQCGKARLGRVHEVNDRGDRAERRQEDRSECDFGI